MSPDMEHSRKIMEYTHSVGELVQFVSGAYAIDFERKLTYADREVLYLLGSTESLCNCCGDCGVIRFISIPGFIKAWQCKTNEAGLPVTEVEPINDPTIRREIKRILEAEHDLNNIEFW